MGNSTFHPIVALLRYKRKNEEVTTLTNVITPPDLLNYINILFPLPVAPCDDSTSMYVQGCPAALYSCAMRILFTNV